MEGVLFRSRFLFATETDEKKDHSIGTIHREWAKHAEVRVMT
jgi:hypothetical protein